LELPSEIQGQADQMDSGRDGAAIARLIARIKRLPNYFGI